MVFTEYETRAYISEIGYNEEIPCMVVDMIKEGDEGDETTWFPGYLRHKNDATSVDGWQVLDMFYNVKYTSPDPNILDQWWDTIISEPPLNSLSDESIDAQDIVNDFFGTKRTNRNNTTAKCSNSKKKTGEINSTEKKMVSTTKHCL